MGMHSGRDATYHALSRDFYWRNLSKHVWNWIRRCPHCIRFKSTQSPHGPMQIRMYKYPFHTLGVDYVDPLPASLTGNKWILTAVCPFSNYLRAIHVPDKTAPTAAHALFQDILLLFGFSAVLQSDRGGEWMNGLLHRLVTLLSIKQAFTLGFRPCMNRATERTHRFLNAALGIYCEKHQEKWEEYLQPAVYAHNTSPFLDLPVSPHFSWCLVGILCFQMSVHTLPANHYAHHLLSRLQDAVDQFTQIKSDLKRHQRDHYESHA